MARYDEDLHENVFFHTLVTKFSDLFREAAENKWMILVPRCDTAARLKLTRSDFENHILRPKRPFNEATTSFGQRGGGVAGRERGIEGETDVDGGGTVFVSANNKHAIINGDTVTVGSGYKEPRSVKILFDECFYNSSDESYQVFCLEQPMEGALGDDVIISLENLEDCNRYLWGDLGGSSERVRKSVDKLLDMFQVDRGTTLRPIMDAASAVYNRAVQEVFKLRKFQSSGQRIFCKLAVETYIMAGLHRKVFKEVCFIVAQKDALLNKITRNLTDTHPQYLGVRPQFRLLIPKAKAILSQLNQFATPLEKLYCFKHCISVILTSPLDGTTEAVTADELLPILVYLVIVCDIPNWNGNLQYINKFHFSTVGMEEFAYFLTSFEAAVEYVRNEALQLATVNVSASGINTTKFKRLRSNSAMTDEETDPIKLFFKSICNGDVRAVKAHLKYVHSEHEEFKAKMCHPLCNCRDCTALQEKQQDEAGKEASVFARDEDGRTGLHHAARLGYNEIVTVLLEEGALVSATDHNSSTPLHLACQKGHQKCTLLLLDDGSSINATNHHGNTPLHLACSNGHEECVKALLFHKGQCNINLTNHQGDTPLHNAARWGYASIVSVLLNHGAATNIINRRRELPHQCAQSRKVQELLAENSRRQVQKGGMVEGGTMNLVQNYYSDSPPTLKKVQRSKRLSREIYSENDRLVKKLFRAIQDGDINYVRYLFGWEDGVSPMVSEELCHPLCQCDRCSKLRKASSITVNSCDSRGYTPLHRAALLGQRKMVQLLLSHGAYIEARTFENQHSPLHLACQYNHRDIVMVLLEHSAQINPQDIAGNTPLHFSCSNGHMDAATLLLIHGADVSLANHRGDTPLHNAARWNHRTLVNELLLYGALYTVTNNNGKTPLDLTTDDEVLDLLKRAMKGEIAVGSYGPLPHIAKDITKSNKMSTTPVPARHGRGGVVQNAAAVEERPFSLSVKRQVKKTFRRDLFGDEEEVSEGEEETGWKGDRQELAREDEKMEAEVPLDEPLLEVGGEVGGVSQAETQLLLPKRENSTLRELLRAIESYDRSASLRPASTYDRSAPLLSLSSSQSSSTSATPPEHTHFHFPSTLTQTSTSTTSESHDLNVSQSQEVSKNTPGAADVHHPADYVFHEQDVVDQELRTITRQTAVSMKESLASQSLHEEEEEEEGGEREKMDVEKDLPRDDRESECQNDEERHEGDFHPHPSNPIGHSSLDSREDFEVLVASASGEDWQLL